jgi:hypothetical protein
MPKRKSDDWMDDELWPRLRSRSAVGSTFFWLVIWGICNFEPWVGFGLMFAWAGSIGLLGGGRKGERNDDHDDDERGFRRQLGREDEQAAAARLKGELVEAAQIVPLLHRQVIADASSHRARLEAAASVADGELGSRLRNMAAKVREVEAGLEADLSRLSDVQRLFTYYLPATADLLQARGALAGSNNAARLAEIDAMIGKLDVAYTDFADRLKGHDARSLEIDLKLLDRALDEEFVLKTKA